MNAAPLFLESFDQAAREVADAEPAVDAASEAERLAAYENGYRSGWDDCLAAEQEAARHIGAELARNLADLGFTYHEARAQLLTETEALLEAFFRTVWPRSAGAAAARMLIEDVLDLTSSTLDVPVEVVACPVDAAVVRSMLPETTTFSLTLVEEPALAEGQVFLRFGTSERAYDMSGLADRLCEAIAARTGDTRERDRNVG